MADDTIPHADPPLVLKADNFQQAEDAPLVISVTPKPNPGLFEAILWGVIFLLTQLIALIGIATIAFGVFAIQECDPAAFVNDQLDKVAKATGDQPEQTEKPEFPNELGQALAYGMLGAQVASLMLILVVLPWRIGKDWKREVAIRMPSVLHLFLIVLITPGFMLLTSGIEELLQQVAGISIPSVSKGLTNTFKSFPWLFTFLAVGFGPGLVEEIWCRGFLGRGLTARYGLVVGVTLTSVIFGLMHCSITYAIPVAFMGIYLHFVCLTSRSIWASVFLHTLNNSFGVLLALTSFDARLEAKLEDKANVIFLLSFSLVFFASISLWLSRSDSMPIQSSDASQKETTDFDNDLGLAASPLRTQKHVQGKISPIALLFTLVSFAGLMFLLFW